MDDEAVCVAESMWVVAPLQGIMNHVMKYLLRSTHYTKLWYCTVDFQYESHLKNPFDISWIFSPTQQREIKREKKIKKMKPDENVK